ncbi:MAG: hypothetical protein WC716_03695 [Chitinophagaceae bacterium]|jgi:hypothetical protein
MKKISFISLLIIIVANTALAKVDKWQAFKEAGFEIEFPYRPKHTTQAVNTSIGTLNIDAFVYETIAQEQDENLSYSVMTVTYPDSTISSDKLELLPNVFRGAIDGGVANMKGKLLAEKTIEYKGFPGREVCVSFDNDLHIMIMRAYLVRNKMYMLQVGCDTAKQKNISCSKFLNSFKLSE